MRKTPFIGLTVLDSGESLFSDNAAFTTRDREEIDRALKIGVRTHRHTGLPGLSDPTNAPSAAVIASAGTIDAGVTITIGYTLEDANGGETLISPLAVVSTPVPLDVPASAPVAELDTSSGELMVDTYSYAITYIDSEGGETPAGPSVIISRDPGPATSQIKLSGLTTGLEAAGATGWRLYRATGGGSLVFLAEGDPSEDEFTDDGLTSAVCDLHPPTENVNTTNQINTLEVRLPSDEIVAESTFINLYATRGASFEESSLLAQYPVASAGANPTFTALEFLDSQPPDVNRSYDSPEQIDPDTELLDWHWKRPVTASANLPAGEKGDVRLAETDGYLFAVLGASASSPGDWTKLGSAGAPGGAGIAASAEVGTRLTEQSELIFVGSGGVKTQIDSSGSEKAKITITGPTVPHLTASAASGSPGSVALVEKMTFAGSGATSVGLASGSGGEARVTITTPPQTPLTASAASGVPGSVSPTSKITLVGSGGISVGLSNPTANEARFTISASATAGGSTEHSNGLNYKYSTNTESGTPGTGKIKFDSTTLSDITEVRVATVDNDGNNVASFIADWDQSTNINRGQLIMRSKANRTTFAVFDVQKRVTSLSGYASMSLTYAGSFGSFSNEDEVLLEFVLPPGSRPSMVEQDAVSESAAGTGNLEWTHDFSDKFNNFLSLGGGLLVLIVANDSTPSDEVSSVTFAGEELEEISSSPFLHSLGAEDGVIYAYFLPEVKTYVVGGTVKVTVSGASTKKAVAISIRSDKELTVIDPETKEAESGQIAFEPRIGRRGGEAVTYVAVHGGYNTLSEYDISTTIQKIAEHDFGTQTALWLRENGSSFGPQAPNFSLGFAGSEEIAGFSVTIAPVKHHGRVSSLPTIVGKGDTCSFQSGSLMSEQGVRWLLEFNGTNWTKIGGPPLYARSDKTPILNNKTSFTALSEEPLSISLPLAGTYDIRIEGTINNFTGGRAGELSYSVGATAAATAWALRNTSGAQVLVNESLGTRHTGTAGATVEEKGLTGGAYEIQFARRRLWVNPVTVE